MEIDPNSLPRADRYKVLIGSIIPRPIAWVSSLSPDGRPNLAPFSFFNGAAATPMTLLFCPANNDDGSEKDTLRNCKPISEGGTGEFVVNIVPEALARQMAACAEPLPYGQSEFELAAVGTSPSALVKPARVHGSPVSFECRTRQVLRLAPGAPGGGNVVIGEVVWISASEGVIDGRWHVDPAQVDAIGRLGGKGYCRTRDRFEMPMGKAALDTV